MPNLRVPRPLRFRWLSILSWLVAVVAATAVGLFAIALIREGISEESTAPLARSQVQRDLATARNAPDGLTSKDTPSPTPTSQAAVTRVFDSRGGSVVARCTGRQAFLVSWTPAQGWSVDDGARGPAETVGVEFEGEDDSVDDLRVWLRVQCTPSGRPVHHVATTNDDHGDRGDRFDDRHDDHSGPGRGGHDDHDSDDSGDDGGGEED